MFDLNRIILTMLKNYSIQCKNNSFAFSRLYTYLPHCNNFVHHCAYTIEFNTNA